VAGIDHALPDCTPKNSANLSPEQLKACSHPVVGPPIPATGVEDFGRNEARDEAHWTASLANQHEPGRVPCVGTQPGPGSEGGVSVMLDLKCGAKGLVNGFGDDK
jgi:hypothetical protein